MAGPNLFHSFEEFSIPTDGSAHFSVDDSIDTIISRVTGSSASMIDGLLKADSTADLFLINPNGITLGNSARLDIGGSLMTSTAESIEFEDGFVFSAVNPTVDPLLTISSPVGLQIPDMAAPLVIEGSGNNAVRGEETLSIGTPSQPNTVPGLQTAPGETLMVIGGEVILDGGILFAPSGQIEIGSVEQGQVDLIPTELGWAASYEEVENFGNIRFTNAALADVSDDPVEGEVPPLRSGSIHLQGDQISFDDGSLLFVQFQGESSDSIVSLDATGTITFLGPNETVPGGVAVGDEVGIFVENLGNGAGGQIQLAAENIKFLAGAGIDSSTFGTGDSPDILVQGLDTIEFKGGVVGTGLQVRAEGPGDGGEVILQSRYLNLENGGVISSQSLNGATGAAGDITIQTAEEVSISGAATVGVPSQIQTSSFGQGPTGTVVISTRRLAIEQGGSIGTIIYGSGSSGRTDITASESVILKGLSTNPLLPESLAVSQISASAIDASPELEQLFGLPQISPEGSTGAILVNTPFLLIAETATINAFHQGTCDSCNGGSVIITADSVLLDTKGNISTFAASGRGGNIDLDIQNQLLLRQASQITATAAGSSPEANGGNITAEADLILSIPRENSDIEATAVAGTGGNILITTDAILGFRNLGRETPLSDLNASSELGVDGMVEITNPDTDVTEALSPPDQAPVDPASLVALGCTPSGSSFNVIGRGGLPSDPNQASSITTALWHDLRLLEQDDLDQKEVSDSGASENPIRLTGLSLDPQNQLWVMAEDNNGSALGCRFLQFSQVATIQEQ